MSIISQKIIDYARSQVGRRVFASVPNAKGECWDLAFQAAKDAGAKTPHDLGNIYKWSSQKVALAQARPGDIIQYFSLKMEVEMVRTQVFDNGDTETRTETSSITLGEPRHTAIIKALKPNGKVEVFEQNIGGRAETQINEYYLQPITFQDSPTRVKVTRKSGRFIIYRPESKL